MDIKKYAKNQNYKKNYNADYWNRFLGDDEFCMDFLKSTFSFMTRQHYLLFINSRDSIEGIVVYEKIPYLRIYKILLLAKRPQSKIKGIGKKFIDFLEKRLRKSILILIDDSDIPDYYRKLGFLIIPDNQRIKKFLGPTTKTCYYKIIA